MYEHTQRAPLHLILWPVAVFAFVAAWAARGEPAAWLTLVAVGVSLAVLASAFATLTVRDRGDHLVVRFGPLPLFSRRIAYRDIESVAAGRSRWIDGLGIHFVPGRGWTWNLWGFGCAELRVAGARLRIGSDDVDALVSFLRERTAATGGTT